MISPSEVVSSAVPRRYFVPEQDLPALARLPEAVRLDVVAFLDLANQAEAHPAGVVAFFATAATQATGRGQSRSTLVRRYYALKKQGWAGLINRAKAPEKKAETLPAAFVQHWQGLCGANQRKCAPAYRKLVEAWNAGEFIPGFGTWRDWWRKTRADLPPADPHFVPPLPEGWSYTNLITKAPTKFELVAERQGLGAAAKYRPKVLSTRAGLRVGQAYQFDDVWHDHKVNVLGWASQAMRPLELGVLDVASASRFGYGVRPILKRLDGTEDRIKESEMRFFVASVLTGTGYLADGCTLYVEHGTAAVSEPMEKMLFDFTGGAIRVERSGIKGTNQLAHLWEGRGKGNPNFKGALESLHNLLHNELADLPAQIGMNRDHAPEHTHGLDRANTTLLKVMQAIPPEYAAQLRMPALPWRVFEELLAKVYTAIDERRDHELEGWVESGNLEREIRLGDNLPWMPAAALTAMNPAQRAAVEAVASLPGNSRDVRLSPAEVFRRQARNLTKLNPCAIPMLLGDLGKREVRIAHDHTVEFQDITVGPSVFSFTAQLHDLDLRTSWLRPGETYAAYFSPFAQDQLHLCDARGRYLGYIPRDHRARRDDLEAMAAQYRKVAKTTSSLMLPLAQRGAKALAARIADAEHNAGVVLAATKAERPATLLQGGGRASAETNAAVLEPACVQAPGVEQPFSDDQLDDLLSD